MAKMRAGNAAKLIVDALLQRFLPLARRRIDTAQAQVRIVFSSSLLPWLVAFVRARFKAWFDGICGPLQFALRLGFVGGGDSAAKKAGDRAGW